MRETSDLMVTQSNALIESAHSMGLIEKRVLLLAISHLDSRKPDRREGKVVITGEEFSRFFHTELKHCYSALREGSEKLYNRSIRRLVHEGKVTKHQRWLESVEYMEGAGSVAMTFTVGVMPLLTLLNREYTSYKLLQIGSLGSFYSIRFYELLSQFRRTGVRSITVERLRETLDLGEKYPKVADLRRYVIDPAVADINENSDLHVKAEPTTKGRKVTGFKFQIEVNDGPDLIGDLAEVADVAEVAA